MAFLKKTTSFSKRALYGCFLDNEGLSFAVLANAWNKKFSWTGMGFSAHNVPSLSKVAIRSSGLI
jgi:hypothetical protein